jgi:hypothetical protein
MSLGLDDQVRELVVVQTAEPSLSAAQATAGNGAGIGHGAALRARFTVTVRALYVGKMSPA